MYIYVLSLYIITPLFTADQSKKINILKFRTKKLSQRLSYKLNGSERGGRTHDLPGMKKKP